MRYKRVFLCLGSNIGKRAENLSKALEYISAGSKIKLMRCSGIYETKAWGFEQQPDFYNQVIEIQTNFSPCGLLHFCQDIEKKMGRKKEFKWSARIIDVDILLFDNIIVNSDVLKIPHKYLSERLFALVPLAELDDSIRLNGKGILELIAGLGGKDSVKLVNLGDSI